MSKKKRREDKFQEAMGDSGNGYSGWGLQPLDKEIDKLVDFFCTEMMDIVQTHYESRADGQFKDAQQIYDSIEDEVRNTNMTDIVLSKIKKQLRVK